MKKTALIIIDVQNGMFLNGQAVYQPKKLLENINKLIDNARLSNAPIFFIQHNAPEGKLLAPHSNEWEIHPNLKPEDEDVIIQKTTPDSFYKTNLDNELVKKKIEHLVLCGIQTEVCVDTTCRRAFSMDYQVTLVADAHSTWHTNELNAEQIINHHNQTLNWFADVKKMANLTWD